MYVTLIEGSVTLVPLKARLLDDSTYEILDNPSLQLEEDATSIWEFFPGDVVTVGMEGNLLVAKELVGSTFPQRKLHQLIFLIVQSLGIIGRYNLPGFEKEIKLLCRSADIFQKNHPLVKSWIAERCSSE